MKATLDLDGLEQELQALFELVKQKVRESEGSTDPDVAVKLMAAAVTMDGMGQILRAIGHHIEEPGARQRFLKLQQRFAGFKGAARGATMATTDRIDRNSPKH